MKLKKRYRGRFVQTTRAQRASLASIKKLLGEKGYLIFPVALWYRRHRDDFLAVPSYDRGASLRLAQKLLLVRPAKKGVVEIRPYAGRTLHFYTQARAALRAHKMECGKMRWCRPLPAKDEESDWKLFIPVTFQKQYELFVDPSKMH